MGIHYQPILDSGVMYAIVVHSATGTLIWRIDTSSPTYTGGTGCINPGSGDPAFWSIQASIDTMFETWGDLPTFKSFDSVSSIITSEISNLSVEGITLLESNSSLLFDQSGNLSVTGIKLTEAELDITFINTWKSIFRNY